MDPVSKDVKEAVCEAEKFFSVTLAQENLSSRAENERSLLADKFKKLKIQLGCENDLPGGSKKAPPRPPKGGIAIPGLGASEAQDGEELYDDVAGVIPQDDYCEMDQGAEGNQNQSQVPDMSGENYEVMSAEQTDGTSQGEAAAGEDYMAMDDEVQEDYEEPQQETTADEDYETTESDKQPPPSHDEEYELPDADSDYEEADKASSSNTAPVETDSMYEGVESSMGEGSVDGAHMTAKERSGSANFDQLMKKTKPESIEGIILEGFLKKLRKEGKIYLGSRWQKRYCVVRNHILYYFKDKKSKEQAGQVLLPGYKAQVANKKGREFTLTHSHLEIRAYQFEGISKEETEKWMKAINAACDAPLSESQTVLLAELRNKQASGDEDSLHYFDAGQAKNEAAEEANGDDVYDDTNEDLYEEVGTAAQSAASNQQSQPPTQDVDYEISAVAVPSKPASVPVEPSPVEPIQEEEYELPEQSSPAPPPPRPTKSQPKSPAEDIPPDLPPPRPSKAQPASPPAQQQDDLYEIADSPEDTSSELPQPPPPLIEEENYEIPSESPPPTPPPMRPPKIPQPPIPKPSPVASQKETHEKIPERPVRPGAKPQPPRPPQRREEPPQSPSENQTNEINYANIYQALWNCDAGDKDELGFQRGDLIYIYEKPHPDWWIGSLFKPQGYSVGLVPKQYVMEAYELSAS